MLQEVAAIKLILTHLLSKLPPGELRDLSEAIHKELQEGGEGGGAMAVYRAKVDEIIAGAASRAQ